ncbi:hypothetical protein G5C51_38425 [Streptomyces sp. A7024]|uniref:Uncharacterized protein n=1 Tax=Streptomyces coryli TaxID=1128680 RepID=A0A6G4UCL5_9ACTN|nr:hypothetical protein [Streptomyces coryli]NGN69752.1 hypothetical protein [Streptomyces coryli]
MDAVRVALLREVLAGTEWLPAARRFAGTLRASVAGGAAAAGGGLLLVGTEAYEPWHLAAHLDDEAAWSGQPELSPTLVRHRTPAGARPHLAVGLNRLEAAGRGTTLLVVAPDEPGAGTLERIGDARRAGATVLAMDDGERASLRELRSLAHEALGADAPGGVDLETVQHLVSAAAGESSVPTVPVQGRRRFTDRLSRLAEQLAAPPPPRW